MASLLELQPPANWDVLAHIDWALAHLSGTVEIRNRQETRAINVPKQASISLIRSPAHEGDATGTCCPANHSHPIPALTGWRGSG